jgi:hypothetical protein
MKSTLIRPAIRLAWICRLTRFHWDRSITRNSNIVDFVSECRICGRRERNKIAWPQPVKPEDGTLLETRCFLTPNELERFKAEWNNQWRA